MANYPFTNYQPQQFGQYQQPFAPQMQPFAAQQQNNFQPQQPLQNQPMVTPMAPASLVGRIVASDQEITANEVPNDGNVGYFPTADGSTIFAKTWTGDGRIDTAIYRKEAVEVTTEPQNDIYDAIIERLERIEELVSTPKPKTTRSRKAASDDE